MWQPDVISIKESDIFAFSLGDTEISRGAHAPVFVTGMLQIAYLVRILFCISQSNTMTLVRGAVVDEQEFPVVVGLGEDAFYGFLDESILIQEDNDDRDERSITHIN